jgi:fumarate reductase subunit D
MIYGVNYIFIIPPILVLLIALSFAMYRLSQNNYRGAVKGFIRTIVYGGLIVFGLFVLFTALYYAGGGH